MNIIGVRELILTVNDMEKQVEFYRDKLGMKVFNPLKNGDYKNAMLATFDTGYCTFRLHANMAKDTFAETSQYLLTFEVEDIEESHKELSSKGVKMSKIKENTPGKFISNFKDPEGNLIRIGSFVKN